MRGISLNNCRTAQVSFALSVLLLVGCVPPGKPNPANRPEMPNQILSFETLYANNCAGCHGADGSLGPAPPLNDPLFVAIMPNDLLQNVVAAGRTGTPMPPSSTEHGGPLTAEQIKVVVDGIKTNWKGKNPLLGPLPTYAVAKSEGAQSVGSADRGAEIFKRACAECHGANGAGIDMDGVAASAINVPAFLALISDQALRRIIITGRPDLGMPAFNENEGRANDFQPLTSSEIDDLVALLASWRAASVQAIQTSP